MLARTMAVIIGLVLVAVAIILWRPELTAPRLVIDLGDLESGRGWLAGLVAMFGGGITIASLLPAREVEERPPVMMFDTPSHRTFVAEPKIEREAEPEAEASEAVAVATAPQPIRSRLALRLEPEPAGAWSSPAVNTASLIAASVAAAEASVAPIPAVRAPSPAFAPVSHALARPSAAGAVARLTQTQAAPAFDAEVVSLVSPAAPVQPPLSLVPSPQASSDPRAVYLADMAAAAQLKGQGRIEDALDSYDEALFQARTLHAAATGDLQANGDLAAALTGVGDCHDEMGRLEAAQAAHQESLGLRRMIVARSPSDPAALRGLVLGLERMADTRETRGHRTRALDLYRERLPIVERLIEDQPNDPSLDRELALTHEHIAALEARLS